jgi:hypothetical protein
MSEDEAHLIANEIAADLMSQVFASLKTATPEERQKLYAVLALYRVSNHKKSPNP